MAANSKRGDGKRNYYKMILGKYDDAHFMTQALNEARKAFEAREVPVGAVVVCEGTIIAKDHNRTKQLNDATAHSEMLALTAAQNHLGSRYLNECTLYVTLEPCSMCAGALFWTQIGGVVIGAPDPERGFSQYSKYIIHPKTTLNINVKADECEHLIKKFFENLRRG